MLREFTIPLVLTALLGAISLIWLELCVICHSNIPLVSPLNILYNCYTRYHLVIIPKVFESVII